MKRVVLLFSLLALSLCLSAQPTAERTLSRDSVEVGDTLLLTLKIRTGKGAVDSKSTMRHVSTPYSTMPMPS